MDLARNFPEEAPLAACQKKLNSKMFEHLRCLFNTAYYISKFNKPFTDFINLITLLNKHDVDTGLGSVVEEYQNDMKCREFVSIIANVIRQEVIMDKDCNRVSLLLHANTDTSNEVELNLYMRYIDTNQKLKKKKFFFNSSRNLNSSRVSSYFGV
jgi:hypothetical protein